MADLIDFALEAELEALHVMKKRLQKRCRNLDLHQIDLLIEMECKALAAPKRQGSNLDLSTLRLVGAAGPGMQIIDLAAEPEPIPIEEPVQPDSSHLPAPGTGQQPDSKAAVSEPLAEPEEPTDPEEIMQARWRKQIPREYSLKPSGTRVGLCGRP